MGRGYHATAEGFCTLCPDFNCQSCAAGTGECTTCLEGYALTNGTCTALPTPQPPAVNQTGTFQLPIAPRIQYLINDGFCAEAALQMSAMYYGACMWVPRAWLGVPHADARCHARPARARCLLSS